MPLGACLLGLAVWSTTQTGKAPNPAPSTAADTITLRDGSVVLGQVLDAADRRGPISILVRRDWAAAHVPERLAAWTRAEAPQIHAAEAQRKQRLEAWKRDRQLANQPDDRILAWVEAELARLQRPDRTVETPLLVVHLPRTSIRALTRKPFASQRMLRLGWLSNFPEVETMPLANLAQALEGRGFDPKSTEPVAVDALLPTPLETDGHWALRRAATELVNDSGGRLIRYQDLLLPEPAAGEAPPAGVALAGAISTLKNVLGDSPPTDPLPAKLAELGKTGKTGVVVTRLALGEDLAGVTIETTLWVRPQGSSWLPARTWTTTGRSNDQAAGAGQALADDPQIKAAFGLIDAIGLGEVTPELKQRALGMGAATAQALGKARGDLDRVLSELAIPLRDLAAKPRP